MMAKSDPEALTPEPKNEPQEHEARHEARPSGGAATRTEAAARTEAAVFAEDLLAPRHTPRAAAHPTSSAAASRAASLTAAANAPRNSIGRQAAQEAVNALPPEATAGEMLRAARLASGLTLAHLTQETKVSAARIEALEAGQLEGMPGIAFTRSLSKRLCALYGIGVDGVLSRLPANLESARAVTLDLGLNEPFVYSDDFGRPSVSMARNGAAPARRVLSAPLIGLLALVVLGLVVVVFVLPALHDEALSTNAVQTIALPNIATPKAVEPKAVEPKAAEPKAAETKTVETKAPAPSAEPVIPASVELQPIAPITQAEAAHRTQMAEAAAKVPAKPTPVPSRWLLVISSERTVSWVGITNAQGEAVYSRALQPGKSVTISENQQLPLHVSIGDARGIKVSVRGAAFDLLPYTRRGSNVANFDVE